MYGVEFTSWCADIFQYQHTRKCYRTLVIALPKGTLTYYFYIPLGNWYLAWGHLVNSEMPQGICAFENGLRAFSKFENCIRAFEDCPRAFQRNLSDIAKGYMINVLHTVYWETSFVCCIVTRACGTRDNACGTSSWQYLQQTRDISQYRVYNIIIVILHMLTCRFRRPPSWYRPISASTNYTTSVRWSRQYCPVSHHIVSELSS